jgi:hypothetical protein
MAQEYAAQGYAVTKRAPLGADQADLIARKGDELIVAEFKLGAWPKQRSEEVRTISNEVVHR